MSSRVEMMMEGNHEVVPRRHEVDGKAVKMHIEQVLVNGP